MALTLDGALPMIGGTTGGLGVGAGALGGGLAGLILGSLLANNGNGLFGTNNNNAVTSAAATDILLNPAFQSLQQQITNLDSDAQTAEIESSIGRVQTQLGAIDSNLAAANFTTLSSINALGRDITATQNQNALQQLNSFNNLQFQNAQATNQIIAQGTANAMAMAQCCCEIKGTILSDGNETRALINSINLSNIQSELNDAKLRISNAEQSAALIDALRPRPFFNGAA